MDSLDLARRYVADGDWARAAAEYRAHHRINWLGWRSVFDEAAALERLGDTARLTDTLRGAARRHPDRPELQTRLAAAFAADGQVDEALEVMDRVVRLAPDDAASWLNRGKLYMRLGRADRALADFERVVALDPGAALGWFGVGAMRLSRREFAEAIGAFERALGLEPRLAAAQNGIGTARLQQGDREGARRAFEAALAIDPNDRPAHRNLERLDGGRRDAAGTP